MCEYENFQRLFVTVQLCKMPRLFSLKSVKRTSKQLSKRILDYFEMFLKKFGSRLFHFISDGFLPIHRLCRVSRQEFTSSSIQLQLSHRVPRGPVAQW